MKKASQCLVRVCSNQDSFEVKAFLSSSFNLFSVNFDWKLTFLLFILDLLKILLSQSPFAHPSPFWLYYSICHFQLDSALLAVFDLLNYHMLLSTSRMGSSPFLSFQLLFFTSTWSLKNAKFCSCGWQKDGCYRMVMSSVGFKFWDWKVYAVCFYTWNRWWWFWVVDWQLGRGLQATHRRWFGWQPHCCSLSSLFRPPPPSSPPISPPSPPSSPPAPPPPSPPAPSLLSSSCQLLLPPGCTGSLLSNGRGGQPTHISCRHFL